MKANKFVEKFGWDAAKEALTLACDKLEHVNYENHAVLISDLKRLVESHDLVINWKLPEDDETGLDGAHLYLDYYATYSSDEEKAKLDRLKQAIADVESCQ